jgi:ABC-2 type transport system ATP-binding protein
MEEAEALASQVGIVDHGKLVAQGAPADLVARLGADVIRVRGRGDSSHFIAAISGMPFVERVESDGDSGNVSVYVDSGSRRLVEIVGASGGNGYHMEDVTVARPSLGDVFLHYTGRALRD